MKAFLRDHKAQAAVPVHGTETMARERRGADSQECQGIGESTRETQYLQAGEEGHLARISIHMGDGLLDSTAIDEETTPCRPRAETWKCAQETRQNISRLGSAAAA